MAVETAEATASRPTENAVIQTRAITKVFSGSIRAVDGLDLSVNEGEIFGLLGPNGAGKTTTVGMLTTRVLPTSGDALVAGMNVVENPNAAKQLIGVVSQSNTLDRSLSVWDNLYFHGRYFGMSAPDARGRASELLERFRLSDRAAAEIDALSGGMAQRVMLARSIVHRPRILFLDEPTAGLDPQSRLALWDVLSELHSAGQTILLTTHYMEEAEQLCHRVAIMDHGKLLALDSPTRLKESVGADTEVRVAADGDLEKLADCLRSFEGATHTAVVDESVRVYLRGSAGVLPRVVDHAEGAGFTVKDLSLSEPTLESVFINLTGRDLRE
ncbi:MAG: ABC transporter ATP-binding protein [Actinomycetota bacterium]